MGKPRVSVEPEARAFHGCGLEGSSPLPSRQQRTMGKGLLYTGILASTLLGYAVYFDYSRRNSAAFRKQLRKNKKALQQEAEKAHVERSKASMTYMKLALETSLLTDPLPTDMAGKEAYFMAQVSEAEKLAAVPGQDIDSAVAFYKALCVYPKPSDLLAIYQKSVPENIYELIILAIATHPPQSLANILGDALGQPAQDDDDEESEQEEQD